MSYTGQSDPTSLSRLRDDLLLERYVCSFPNVELRAVPGQKRRGLFATAPIARNAAILVESACCWQEGGPSGALYAPLHTPDELDGLLYQLSPFYASPGGAALPAPLPRAELAARVMRENSFGIGAPSEDSQAAGGAYGQGSQGRAVYLAVSMCNHSCQPSARASQEGGALALQEDAPLPRRVLEARRDIAAGEEVTISYVPVTWMRAPRAAVLQASWGFQCQCQRCTAPRDDTIVRKPRQGGEVEGGGGSAAAAGGGGSVEAEEAEEGRGSGLVEALCAPGKPRELLSRLVNHETHELQDVRLFLTLVRLYEAFRPAPALRQEALQLIRDTAAKMPYIEIEEIVG